MVKFGEFGGRWKNNKEEQRDMCQEVKVYDAEFESFLWYQTAQSHLILIDADLCQ